MDIEKTLRNLRRNVPLSRYTTFGIGGTARYFVEVDNQDDLERAIRTSKELNLPFLILGNGSNMLVSDEGYGGIVIKMSGQKVSLEGDVITSDSGVLLSFLASSCLKAELSGLEWIAGIPGTVGGAIRGNAGAFGSSISDTVVTVDFMDTRTGRKQTISNEKCEFGYRESIFKKDHNLIILEAKMRLEKKDPAKIKEKTNEYLDYRKERHPRDPSAGSIFKSHQIRDDERDDIISRFPSIEKFGDSIPAAFLIDQSGLKGERSGDAMISTLHPNFIINTGKAEAEDVKKLIALIKKKVNDKFRILLEEEIQYVGFKT